jgi:hypothetical protein
MSDNNDNTTPETVPVAKLQAAEERARNFEAKLTDLEKKFDRVKDINPDDVAGMRASLQEYERKAAEGKSPEELERVIKDQLEGNYNDRLQAQAARIEELEGLNGSLKGSLKELSVVDKAMGEIGGMFNDDCHVFIKQCVRDAVDVNEQGDFIIKDDSGNPRFNAAGKPMTLSDYAQELIGKHSSMAKPQVKDGGKQPGQKMGASSSGTPVSLPAGFDSYSQQEKQDWFAANPEFKPARFRLN